MLLKKSFAMVISVVGVPASSLYVSRFPPTVTRIRCVSSFYTYSMCFFFLWTDGRDDTCIRDCFTLWDLCFGKNMVSVPLTRPGIPCANRPISLPMESNYVSRDVEFGAINCL